MKIHTFSSSQVIALALQRYLTVLYPTATIEAGETVAGLNATGNNLVILDNSAPPPSTNKGLLLANLLELIDRQVISGLARVSVIDVSPCKLLGNRHLYNIADERGCQAREIMMDECAKYTSIELWHDIKHWVDVEKSLRCLELVHGFHEETAEYRRLYKLNKDEAQAYAIKMLKRLHAEVSASGVVAHRSLLEQGDPEQHPRVVGVLFVDDQDDWYTSFRHHAESFNSRNREFKLDVRYARNADQASLMLVMPGFQAVVLDYYIDRPGFGSSTGRDTEAMELAREFRQQRPELAIFGLTGQPLRRVSAEWQVDRVFSKSENAEINELLLAITSSVRTRSATPFFSALLEYSRYPVAVFHALPLSRAKSVAGSQWAREFAEFYGEGYFAAETSSTLPPLDNIFHPAGSLRQAQQRAARAFYSIETFFVTNGTTGANNIVYRALLQPGDLVLLDRNCHRSHHYSVAQCNARVVYMEPEHNDEFGISSLVSTKTIIETVERHKAAKMLVLTHPTFDGVLYDPETIIRKVLSIKPDIIFLFDEAWFAYGVFHHKLRERSSAAAAKSLREKESPLNARVYVTQSIHKTLSAMRQGSMIHVCDPQFNSEVRLPFEEAFITNTTTSPNLHILGSLDVARMQAEMEGFDRLQTVLNIANWIREQFKTGDIVALPEEQLIPPSAKAGYDLRLMSVDATDDLEDEGCHLVIVALVGTDLHIRIFDASGDKVVDKAESELVGGETLKALKQRLSLFLEESSLSLQDKQEIIGNAVSIAGHTSKAEGMLDPLKITLRLTGESGAGFRDQILYRRFGIQVNKYSHNTVLLLVTIGTTWSMADHLVRSLKRIGNKATQSTPLTLSIPRFSQFDPQFGTDGSGDLGAAYNKGMRKKTPQKISVDDAKGKTSATFVTPYPPGYPILVPGQVIDASLIYYLNSLRKAGVMASDIHGLVPTEPSVPGHTWELYVL